MNPLIRFVAFSACMLLLPCASWSQEEDAPEQPPTPAFQSYPANTSYTVGHVRLMYVGPHPKFYFSLSVMPEGVDYFLIDTRKDTSALQLKTIQLAAEHGWHIGVFHQQRLTTNIIETVFVTSHIPPPK